MKAVETKVMTSWERVLELEFNVVHHFLGTTTLLETCTLKKATMTFGDQIQIIDTHNRNIVLYPDRAIINNETGEM